MIPVISFKSKWWLLAVGLSVTLPMAMASAAQAELLNAQWRTYDLQFNVSSFHTYYNCDNFEDTLKRILRQLGAKEDVRVTTMGCTGRQDVSSFVTSHIKVQMPVAGETAEAGFNAAYKPVKLTSSSLRDTAAINCELLDEVRRQLLPALHLSVVKGDVQCVTNQPTPYPQTLEVNALIAEEAAH